MIDLKSGFDFERRKTKFIFNLASIIYPFIENNLFPQYRETLAILNLSSPYTVLDLATGTGILAGAFAERGHAVKGVDFSKRLLKRARQKFPQVQFELIDLFHLNEMQNPLYDIVSMGYLLHGLSPALREIILKKAVGLTRKFILIFDHGRSGNWVVGLIELLEGSYYKQFVAEDRQKVLREAGLLITTDFQTSDYGHVWLCEKM